MIKYNVGCGKRDFGPGWVNVDGNQDYIHVKHGMISLLYEPANYIDLLYSSHLIGYLDRVEFAYILDIWYQKVKPGRVLRLATPDFDILSKFYNVTQNLDLIKGPLFGEMEMNGQKIFHKTTYDEKTLTGMLTDAGFINIRRYDHRKTEHPNTGNRDDFYDDHSAAYINNTLISLNIECNKP